MTQAEPKMHLWVVEATLDLPIRMQASPTNKSIASMYVSLGGEDPDGFVQMRPVDPTRATTLTFWAPDKPIVYEARALVRAPQSALALMRGKELFEHLADRLTLLTGYPARVLGVEYTYDEDMLRQCLTGENHEYDATTSGPMEVSTQAPMNWHFPQLLNPPKSALEAIRWFRHGMSATRPVDQYLFYYIALESIARHVPGVTRGPRRNSKGEEEEGLETQENAAIKHLISRHATLPPNARQTLAVTRARIAHGNADIETLELAGANLPVLQRLAADGIALVYGVDPNRFNVCQPSFIRLLAPILRAQYTPEDDPSRRWNGLLTDAFAKYLEQTKSLQS